MSGDQKEQPNIFYSKEETDAKDVLMLHGKVKSVYEIGGEAKKVHIKFHDKTKL